MPGSRLTRRWVLRGIYAAGQSVLSFEFWVFEFWVLSLSFETDKEVSFEGNICRGKAVRNRRVSCPILSKGIRTALNRPAQTFCYCFSSIKSIQLFCISCRPGHNCFASTGAQDNHSVPCEMVISWSFKSAHFGLCKHIYYAKTTHSSDRILNRSGQFFGTKI